MWLKNIWEIWCKEYGAKVTKAAMCSRSSPFFSSRKQENYNEKKNLEQARCSKNPSCISWKIWENGFGAGVEKALLLKGNDKYLQESKQNCLKILLKQPNIDCFKRKKKRMDRFSRCLALPFNKVPSSHCWFLATTWTSSCNLLGKWFSEVACPCLFPMAGRKWLAQGHPAGCVPKAGVELM